MADPSPSFAAIDDAYTAIQATFPDVYSAASAADKPAVLQARNTARDARDDALNKLFASTDARVASLTTQLQASVTAMNADLDGLKDVAKFLDLAASAAKLAGQLARLAA
jgi:hypothetical protein